MSTPASPARTERLPANAGGIARAAALLAAGGTVAFPTETVYGLGADATSGEAVARIYAAKGRPSFNPLIAHCATAEAAFREGAFDPTARKLADAFWPGPLTLVVPLAAGSAIADLTRAGLATIGLRVPGNAIAKELLEAFGKPVAAPSANLSGHVSPTNATHVLADLDGRIDAVLDGGATRVGLESTIVSCLDGTPRLLRPGGVPRAAIEAVLGAPLEAAGEAVLAPGMLASHYAPATRLRLDATEIFPGEAALLFGPVPPRGLANAIATKNLSPRGDLVEAAANLFAALRELDSVGAAGIAVAPIPPDGLGEAIRDRLARAAVGS